MLRGTREPALASWRALGTSVVLQLVDPGALAHARRIVESIYGRSTARLVAFVPTPSAGPRMGTMTLLLGAR